MKVQPDPCPYEGTICREVSVQTRTKTTLEWKRQCLECGRLITRVEYNTKPPAVSPHGPHETYPQAAARWLAIEKQKERRRRRRKGERNAPAQ